MDLYNRLYNHIPTTPTMSEDNLRNPFVVSCKKCNKILTDSFTLSDYRSGHLIHSFSTVKEDSKIETGKGEFEGCLVQRVACTCGKSIGVLLTSAGEGFNGHAGCYAFVKDEVRTYMLGSVIGKEKGLIEVMEDVEKLKSVVSKIYKKVYQ